MSKTVRTRFAPSPTGFLHVGGARTALYNWLFARKNGGKFILRVEDTDAARNTEESVNAVLEGLRWLGLDWDEGPGAEGDFGPYFQSERNEIYDRYLKKLVDADLAYEDDGAMRFRVPDREIVVNDAVCGEVRVNLKEQGSSRWDAEAKVEIETNPDLVIRRPDGSYIFHFVNVVDDIEMGMTHVIRGEDHLPNTPKHLALFEAFGAEPPIFAHIPLNLNPDGSKMSKRSAGAHVEEYLNKGYLPAALNNYMALLGWSPKDDREILTMAEMAEMFTLEGVNQSNSRFDFEKCKWVNAEHIKLLSDASYLEQATPFVGVDSTDPRIEAALTLGRERIQIFSELKDLLAPIFTDSLEYDPESVAKVTGREGVGEALQVLASKLEAVENWEVDDIKAGIHLAAEELGVKLGALMLPCRVAAAGSTSGPDLVPMLELIGKSRVVERIRGFQEKL